MSQVFTLFSLLLDWRSRVELIQDFEFPEASIRVKTTRDGRFVMATGVYKPQIRVFEYAEMSMKFDRHTDSENINFVTLSDDWTKSVLLQNDRTIEFHTQGGIYYKTRIPKFGRDLAYHYPTCDLLITAASYEVYRLNLNQGRFLNPISTDATSGVNVCVINPAHQLFGFGTQDGVVEFWDPRSRSRVGLLSPSFPIDESNVQEFQITAMSYRNDGLSLAVGTSTGHILLYDLRNSSPWLVKDHQYGYPIKNINWYDNTTGDGGRGKVISADSKIMKIWDRENGANFTSVEPNTDINDVCIVPDSGLIFIANEGIQIGAYYIPSLGPAPRWCSFLDNLTEEMEENPQPNIYDDYKFVTRKELSSLGMDHLIGTNVMKPYMHGFFVDLRLYEQAKLISNPFAYAEYRERVIKEKLEAKRESRIRVTKKLPKVNKELASRLLHSSDKKKKGSQGMTNILQDERFTELFTNPEYEVDKDSIAYQLTHPSGFTEKATRKEHDDEDEDDDNDNGSNKSDDGQSDETTRSEFETDSDDGTMLFSEKYSRSQYNHTIRHIAPAVVTLVIVYSPVNFFDYSYLISQIYKKKGLKSAKKMKKIDEDPIRSVRLTQSNRQEKRHPKMVAMKTRRISHADEPFINRNQTTMGNMEMSFMINNKPRENKKSIDKDSHRTRLRNRRPASKNVFRGL
ncbi:12830_t:CDS:10 [Dentiscutata erythropus]|uniref:12830_t:CDS:1 n=1 Tax=Dentiscutata erythropus TaxID=1348616 RepID=A0A9N9ALL4_9GLOM|nr:12830_t:CDS:10 [Dentiscutata erythropus]